MKIGIDLGGTKIEIIALDEQGSEIFRKRVPTPSGDYQGTVEAMISLVQAAEKKTGKRAERIGVGTPGAVSPATGLIKNSNSTCLIGKPLHLDLKKALGRPVILANDANCFALSEATDGAGAGFKVVFGVILGTGVGGGIVVNGQVLEGANAIAGEWGHNPLPWMKEDERDVPRCYCGKIGCVETFLSGPGLSRDHAHVTGKKLNGEKIVALAEKGDAQALETLARYEDRLARALTAVVNFLDPDAIVLGGGLSGISRLYYEVPRLWKKYVFSDEVTTRIFPAKYGDSSGVRGAAWL